MNEENGALLMGMRKRLSSGSILRCLAFATVLLATITSSATNDETACDLDGIRNVLLNGKRYPGVFQISQSGRHEGSAIYSFAIQEGRRVHNIQLIVLFDDDDAVRAVTGFYFDRTASDSAMSDVQVFRPTFKPIEIEDLPSAKARGN